MPRTSLFSAPKAREGGADIKPSAYQAWADGSLLALGTAAALALALCVAAPQGPALEPVSLAAGLYVLSLYASQAPLMEWPYAEANIVALLCGAFVLLTLPTVLLSFNWWSPVSLWAARFFGGCLILAAYRCMVRGPVFLPEPNCMKGRVCVITGCNSGIGYETALALLRSKAHVIFACRSEARAKDAMERALQHGKGAGVTKDQLEFIPLDTSSLNSVREFAKQFQERGLDLHVLLLNAGVILTRRELSVDGHDLGLASNHLGHFLLVQLLMPSLLATEKKGGQPRIVSTGSSFALRFGGVDFGEMVKVDPNNKQAFLARGYGMFQHYGHSKFAQQMFIVELSRRLQKAGSNIPVNGVHPGMVNSEIAKNMPFLGWAAQTRLGRSLLECYHKSAPNGCHSNVYACTSANMATAKDMSGQFLMRMAPVAPNPAWMDEAEAQKLWEMSTKLTAAPALLP